MTLVTECENDVCTLLCLCVIDNIFLSTQNTLTGWKTACLQYLWQFLSVF